MLTGTGTGTGTGTRIGKAAGWRAWLAKVQHALLDLRGAAPVHTLYLCAQDRAHETAKSRRAQAIVQVIETSVAARRKYQFFVWTQGSLQLLLPHQQVLCWVRDGMNNQEIGVQLGIGPLTVKNHVQKILRKLGAANRAQAVARAMNMNLLRRAAGDTEVLVKS